MDLSVRWANAKNMAKKLMGFSLLELIIILSIMSTLIMLATSNLFGAQYNASFTTSFNTVLSDINHQRLKAMTGDTTGQSPYQNYGIYFETDAYILFAGTNYNPVDPANFTVSLGDNVAFFNNIFNQSQIIFAAGSGEVLNYNINTNSIGIRHNVTGEQKTITVNSLGTISQVN